MQKKGQFDTILLVVVLCILFFGLVMVSSVSVYQSYQITSNLVKKGLMEDPTNSFYLWRHIWRVVIAVPVCFVMMYFPLNIWKKTALWFFIASILLLVSLFLPGIGANYGTATSWINIPLIPSLQPAEFVKLALIFYLALWMEKREELVQSFQYGFLPFTFLLSAVVILLALQPDFGSVLVISSIAVSMFFAAGGNVFHIFGGALLAAGMAYPIIMSKEYIKNRFMVFLDPSIDPLNIGFQIKQALIAIGSGGWFGVGFGKSIQKFGYLPEVQGDTIFAAASEELGFIRITVVVLAFLIIAYRGYSIAKRAPNRFLMLVSVGITSWFVFQAIINICVNVSLMPITGLTLPFVSYGGTSIIVNMMAAGILLNISRYAQEKTYSSNRRGLRGPYYSQPRGSYRA